MFIFWRKRKSWKQICNNNIFPQTFQRPTTILPTGIDSTSNFRAIEKKRGKNHRHGNAFAGRRPIRGFRVPAKHPASNQKACRVERGSARFLVTFRRRGAIRGREIDTCRGVGSLRLECGCHATVHGGRRISGPSYSRRRLVLPMSRLFLFLSLYIPSTFLSRSLLSDVNRWQTSLQEQCHPWSRLSAFEGR